MRRAIAITTRWLWGLIVLLAWAAVPAVAQSCDWASGFDFPGTNGTVRALAVFDDGSGPALYAGGGFTTVGGVSANNIAKWDGKQWSPLGDGMNRGVSALAVFDDGSGPALYAGGFFTTAGGVSANNIAKWDGKQWSPLGSGMSGLLPDVLVLVLAVFDDGSGPALYAGGNFTTAGGRPAIRIAKWDGKQWSPLGSGMSGSGFPQVSALAVFDDGGGPALYAGGQFTSAGGRPANHIAKWDGKQWSPLGSGMNNVVLTLAVFDDGSGPALYAGGQFTSAGGVMAIRIAKWDGSQWSPLGNGMNSTVVALAVFDDGSGPALYAGGVFRPNQIAKWDGSQWSPLGSGMSGATESLFPYVSALAVFDDGNDPALYAGGDFTMAGGVGANRIAKWDGSQWSPLGSGSGMNNAVSALAVFDDGTGPALYAGGGFTSAGGVSTNRIAKWDGTQWSPLGSGINGTVVALAVFDDGSGPALYAGGRFIIAGGVTVNYIAKWDGKQWSALGRGISGGDLPFVSELTVFDNGTGPALYAGGGFTMAGGVVANNIAKWDGSQWSPLGDGMNRGVSALAVFDDGSGPALYAGGNFTTAGGVFANHIAKWDGKQWSPLGSGMSGGNFPNVSALAVFDDGSGPALYAGGNFTTAGGVFANHIAKWDGKQWSPLGSGISGLLPNVSALAVFDDGSGPALYAGGPFTSAGGVTANRIAKWDGKQWSPLGSGMSGGDFPPNVFALAVFDDGSGPALYAGGRFTSAEGKPSSNIAAWRCAIP